MDRFTRTLGLNRAAEEELASLPAETSRALEAYAAGVNAWRELCIAVIIQTPNIP